MAWTPEAKISSTLPKTDHGNGLHSIAGKLAAEPERRHYAVVLLDAGKVEHKFESTEDGDRYELIIPHARILSIEPLDGSDAAAAERLMLRARDERMGMLPFHAMATKDDDQ